MFHLLGKIFCLWSRDGRAGGKSKQSGGRVCAIQYVAFREGVRQCCVFVCQGELLRWRLSSDEDMCCLSYFTCCTMGSSPAQRKPLTFQIRCSIPFDKEGGKSKACCCVRLRKKSEVESIQPVFVLARPAILKSFPLGTLMNALFL